MDCPTEEALIRNKLGGLAAVSGMEFNLMQRVLAVVHQDNTLAAVETAIRDLGMSTEPMEAVSFTHLPACAARSDSFAVSWADCHKAASA